MAELTRPNPDDLLALAQQQESEQARGKLKIFLGAAPGVGKTYTMLQDAQRQRAAGLDVVIGIVESHGRAETQALFQGFELLPRLACAYRGKILEEFDLDAALARHPALVIVDEMAHTNAADCRHEKRWQDIKELIDRGIDVYTTLNVQHIESLNDIVAQITGIRVQETVPDSIIEQAHTIELIDLPPDDLLKRLQEGKVYFPEQAKLALKGFFSKANLVALRELALRFTAEQVNAEVQSQRLELQRDTLWTTSERLLVCVGADESSAKLIRAARRMASRLQAEWTAVYVQSPRLRLTEAQEQQAHKNLRLAEQLGAQTAVISGRDIVKEIIAYAQMHNVSKIVIGKQIRPRWKDLLFGSLVDELVRHSNNIDLYIIREDTPRRKFNFWQQRTRKSSFGSYVIATGVIALITGCCLWLYPRIENINIIMLYLMAAVCFSLLGRRGPAFFAGVLSIACLAFFFLPPRFNFSIDDVQYLFTLFVLLLISQIISHLTVFAQEKTAMLRARERYLSELYNLSKQLAATWGMQNLLSIGSQYVAEILDADVTALVANAERQLYVKAYSNETEPVLTEKEMSVAQWAYDLGQPAGLGTETLPHSKALYLPLIGGQRTIGVLSIQPHVAIDAFDSEAMRLLQACATQIAAAVEVSYLQEEAEQIQITVNQERLRSTLLSSVSHDLKTPLTTILGAASSLAEFCQGQQRTLANTIVYQSQRLNRLISNLLQTVSLESGEIKLHKERHSIEEVIGSSLTVLSDELQQYPLTLKISPTIPLVLFDNILLEQVFINLIENALRYGRPGTPIEISAASNAEQVEVSISDGGSGIDEADLDKIFTKFYRGSNAAGTTGTGLGLAICYSIIQAHGGKMWAQRRQPSGVTFYFTLPLDAK